MTEVTIRDGELSMFVSVTGSGPPLLWVAGLGDDHSSWATQIPRFTTEYTCIVFDNRGCGLSSTPPGPYTIAEMAQDVHLLLAELDTGPVTAIGSSMGGAISQELAAAHPADVSAVVLEQHLGRHHKLHRPALFDQLDRARLTPPSLPAGRVGDLVRPAPSSWTPRASRSRR